MLSVGIIGAGLIGQKRAGQLPGAKLVAVSDRLPERAQALANSQGAQVVPTWQELVKKPGVDIVIVCTTNDVLSACAIEALRCSKHVLVEKPAGRNPEDLQALIQAGRNAKSVI